MRRWAKRGARTRCPPHVGRPRLAPETRARGSAARRRRCQCQCHPGLGGAPSIDRRECDGSVGVGAVKQPAVGCDLLTCPCGQTTAPERTVPPRALALAMPVPMHGKLCFRSRHWHAKAVGAAPVATGEVRVRPSVRSWSRRDGYTRACGRASIDSAATPVTTPLDAGGDSRARAINAPTGACTSSPCIA